MRRRYGGENERRSEKLESRENFRSRLGFILVSAGCAIGIGNVWKFPYVTGANGGGVFVLFYILSLIIMGVPILTMELAVGRASRKSAVEGYRALEPNGSRWHVHGWLCVIGCCLLMMYYTTVSGWMLGYCFKFAAGTFSGMAPADVDTVWTNMLANPAEMALWMVLIVVAGFIVCSFGLQKGLERISKWMMICLLTLIVILAVNSLTLEGAMEGVKFYLLPDFEAGGGGGHRQRDRGRHEPVLLHFEPGHRRHGDLRQLHVRRQPPPRRGGADLLPGHLRGLHVRHDHLPRLLQLRHRGG